jgi:hypothetical protein
MPNHVSYIQQKSFVPLTLWGPASPPSPRHTDVPLLVLREFPVLAPSHLKRRKAPTIPRSLTGAGGRLTISRHLATWSQFLARKVMVIKAHPPDSLDVAPSNFYLFDHVKGQLTGELFRTG